MSFPKYDIEERDSRYFVRHFDKSGDVKAEHGPFLSRNAAERRVADLNKTVKRGDAFGRYLNGWLSRTGKGQGQ